MQELFTEQPLRIKHYCGLSGCINEQKRQKPLSSQSLHSSRIDNVNNTGKLRNSLGDEIFYGNVIEEI